MRAGSQIYTHISDPFSATIGIWRVKPLGGDPKNVLTIHGANIPLGPEDFGFDQSKEDRLVKIAVGWTRANNLQFDEISIVSD
ncbi:hypothetical protein A1351_21785 [Methylosinus sp. R-45379]|uniref:hypothetical protein n=1 Tax=Methylosinus sp. R-45379 TaxID=980563 RepID=UPI0007C93C5E|nr:hypothetical protein [Methylosinus sp. R-45379]OAI31381.1 hypothetical protein A1351_21785 [Methylosinus sp. R-45379]